MAERHQRELKAQGFTVFEELFSEEWVEAARRAVQDAHEACGRPACYRAETSKVGEGAYVGPAGFALPHLLPRCPRLARDLVPKPLVEILDALMGPLRIEVAGAVAVDRTRPLFAWHSHIGGVDDNVFRRAGRWPEITRTRRVMTLTYLQDLDAETGPLQVFPRGPSDACAPPFDLRRDQWPGSVELTPKAGSTVVVDERTWHAIPPMQREGLRIFVGVAYASQSEELGGWSDPDRARIAELAEVPPLLARLVLA